MREKIRLVGCYQLLISSFGLLAFIYPHFNSPRLANDKVQLQYVRNGWCSLSVGCKNNGNSIVTHSNVRRVHTHTPKSVAHHSEIIPLIHMFAIDMVLCRTRFLCHGLYLYRSWVTFVPRLIHRLLKWCKLIFNIAKQHHSTIADSFFSVVGNGTIFSGVVLWRVR